MTLSVRPLADTMGAEASGIDLRSPVDEATAAALNDALHEHIVLCVRNQCLTPAELVQAAGVFGTPMPQVNAHLNFPELPEIGVLSSEDRDLHGTGERVIRGTTWHTDHSFKAVPPKATILYALVVPERGGETSFCNMRAAYASLDEDTQRRVDALRGVHTYESSRSANRMMVRTRDEVRDTPDVVHPLARTHPANKTKALYMSTTRLECIDGLERADSDALIERLLTHATQQQFLYDHVWRVHDFVIWDNRCSMHHANANYPLDQRRLLHRIIVEGEVPA